jgi:hypothetical protein
MTITPPPGAYAIALVVLARTAVGLFVHGLRYPGEAARITPGGRVAPR